MEQSVLSPAASGNIAKEAARRRTFAIISHPDAGKTTLTEKLLLFGGAIQAAGTVKARKSGKYATSDWMAIEKERGISVASSVMQFEYQDCVINLLDTPGHRDFSEDTYRVLTAVDAALMVIDGTKGVEAQTIKLLEVCRNRGTPIITFINKLDREGRHPLELIDEIEDILKIHCAPLTWPVGMGKRFAGVYDLRSDRTLLYAAADDRDQRAVEALPGLDHPRVAQRFAAEVADAQEEVGLIRADMREFDREHFLEGELTPVFFGSAINNFGVDQVLDMLVAEAPPPSVRPAVQREVRADEPKFSAFVFKIQANMDPQHRDRIAFLRICSGRFERGMRLFHTRTGKELRASQVVAFLSQRREIVEDAWPGDIIGLLNHGSIDIGDTFTEGEMLTFTGIPYFAPEMFRLVTIANPMRAKQLSKGLQQLGEEGAIQVFRPLVGNDMILGAVGQLQFEVTAHRLQAEYGVDARLHPLSFYGARWISSDNPRKLAEFESHMAAQLAHDASGSLTFLATSRPNLELTRERWPDIQFHALREHALSFADTSSR
ncbi:MAG TPA: peptide chain release factor 3 [Burkholderiales bacterium]|nr:peptide chain release factor 3 [Burkholderiales bacterium]